MTNKNFLQYERQQKNIKRIILLLLIKKITYNFRE